MTAETQAPKPLTGVRVLDLGQIYQGPYAGFLLAQAGADVVKIEPPGGEPLRRREVHGGPPSFPLAFLNSNKRSVVCDLKVEEGRDLLRRLAGAADVLVENFAPGVLDRLGVGWERLKKLNPRLIYASGTAYGLSGPDRDRLGMDITVQAASGVMSITGEAGRPPLKAGPALIDFLGGVHLYGGIVSALYERERTGRGRLVEVAMQEAEGLVSAWTATRSRAEVCRAARDCHVPCAPVRDLAEVNADPHLLERGFLETLDHPTLGEVTLPTSPLRFDGQSSGPLEPSCELGRDTERVIAEWLGG